MDGFTARIALVAVLVLAGCTGQLASDPSTPAEPTADLAATYTVTVTTVVDGDTVRVRFENGTTDTVRLLGIDTPETRGDNDPGEFEGVPDTAAGRSCLAAAGGDATNALKARVLGERVVLGLDADSDRRGYYGRLLGYLYENESNVNYELVRDGHARLYESTFSAETTFADAERYARSQGVGLWTCATESPPTPTPSPTATPLPDGGAPLVVEQIHADAAGDDRANLNDEYVVLDNRGERALAAGGWTIADEAGHEYTFPSDATIPADGTITLRTGSGTDSASTYYWNRGSPVWNNDGDTAVVRAPNGTVLASRATG